MKTTVGNLSWTYATLKDDLPAQYFYGEASTVLPKGTVVRYYDGTVDVTLDGKKKTLVSPAPDGTYLVETVPDGKSRFWQVYTADLEYINLLESDEYANTQAERNKHLFIAKLPVAEPWWKNQIVDSVLHLQLDGLQVEPTPPPANGSGGSGGSGGGGSGGEAGFPWLAVGLGVGLAALIAMLVGKDDKGKVKKGKGKRVRRRRAARRRARRVRRVT